MTDAIGFSFEVACSPDWAFELWTTRISTWWPADHSVSRAPDLRVVLEGHLGGRIYERTPSGEMHEWGRVTAWDPPSLLAYTWHLGSDPGAPTDVVIRFSPTVGGGTRVEISHQGWERLGADGHQQRENNSRGWEGVLPCFIAATEGGGE